MIVKFYILRFEARRQTLMLSTLSVQEISFYFSLMREVAASITENKTSELFRQDERVTLKPEDTDKNCRHFFQVCNFCLSLDLSEIEVSK